jgi:hypothetical protein
MEIVTKSVLAENLHIQPSEVDAMEDWEVAGYMEYVKTVARMRDRKMKEASRRGR